MCGIATGTLRSVIGPLWTTIVRAWRLLVAFWPALIAWILVGNVGRYIVVEAAGWVGYHNSIAGLALMPFAILFRLVALVAMLLVVRDGMPQLTAVAPVPTTARERSREFVNSVLAGIFPFFAFYLAWGFLRDDMVNYYNRVYEVALTNVTFDPNQTVNTGDVRLTWFTGTVIVVTLLVRRVLRRLQSKSSRVVPVLAVYAEALWVFLSALIISDLVTRLKTWAFSRQGVAWFDGIRQWIADQAAPLDRILDAGGWLLGEAGGIMLYPLAWLTIAGVIFGQTIEPPKATRRITDRLTTNRRLKRVHNRVTAIPEWFGRRIRDVWDELVGRFRPIGNAIRLMWHVGPVIIAGYVLMYQGYLWIEATLKVVVSRLFGPHPFEFWQLYSPAIFLIAPVVAAPLGIAIVGATFDSVLLNARRSHRDPVDGSPETPAANTDNARPNVETAVDGSIA